MVPFWGWGSVTGRGVAVLVVVVALREQRDQDADEGTQAEGDEEPERDARAHGADDDPRQDEDHGSRQSSSAAVEVVVVVVARQDVLVPDADDPTLVVELEHVLQCLDAPQWRDRVEPALVVLGEDLDDRRQPLVEQGADLVDRSAARRCRLLGRTLVVLGALVGLAALGGLVRAVRALGLLRPLGGLVRAGRVGVVGGALTLARRGLATLGELGVVEQGLVERVDVERVEAVDDVQGAGLEVLVQGPGLRQVEAQGLHVVPQDAVRRVPEPAVDGLDHLAGGGPVRDTVLCEVDAVALHADGAGVAGHGDGPFVSKWMGRAPQMVISYVDNQPGAHAKTSRVPRASCQHSMTRWEQNKNATGLAMLTRAGRLDRVHRKLPVGSALSILHTTARHR